MADPYVLGTASGAALGAAIAVIIPVRFVILEFGLIHGLAFASAPSPRSRSSYKLSRQNGLAPMTSLLLTGYAVGSLLAAVLAMAMYVSGAALRQIFTYLLGGLRRRDLAALPSTAADHPHRERRDHAPGPVARRSPARASRPPRISASTSAANARILLALASLVTAAAVAISGLIGFVGLVVPHVVRLIVGPSGDGSSCHCPRSVGAALLADADIVARLVGDIPVGVVTAILGAPFFLFLLYRARTGYEL